MSDSYEHELKFNFKTKEASFFGGFYYQNLGGTVSEGVNGIDTYR